MANPITEEILSQLPKEYGDATESIQSRLPANFSKPDWGIICGSGLSGLGDHIVDKITIDYDTIPVSETVIQSMPRWMTINQFRAFL